MTLGMWDIYEWYFLHHRGAVLRGMGTFSESVVFHFASQVSFLVSGFRLFVLCFASCFLCLLVTPRFLSHFFSHTGELSIKTKRIDDRLSFKSARHRQKKNLHVFVGIF